MKTIQAPLSKEDVMGLTVGETVLVNGTIYTARDAAHQRMAAAIEAGDKLPFDPQGQVIYYTGPSPAPPGRVIGSAGPTTSGRMDIYAPLLIERGLRVMIGKGERNQAVKDAMCKHGAVYLATVAGRCISGPKDHCGYGGRLSRIGTGSSLSTRGKGFPLYSGHRRPRQRYMNGKERIMRGSYDQTR